ncbi:MAG: hypothetical protein PHN74_03255 [Candidatus Pacebacteria bacterium]|nr:hypothetical protein [Candidatus Paceibacterota bacterium]
MSKSDACFTVEKHSNLIVFHTERRLLPAKIFIESYKFPIRLDDHAAQESILLADSLNRLAYVKELTVEPNRITMRIIDPYFTDIVQGNLETIVRSFLETKSTIDSLLSKTRRALTTKRYFQDMGLEKKPVGKSPNYVAVIHTSFAPSDKQMKEMKKQVSAVVEKILGPARSGDVIFSVQGKINPDV